MFTSIWLVVVSWFVEIMKLQLWKNGKLNKKHRRYKLKTQE